MMQVFQLVFKTSEILTIAHFEVMHSIYFPFVSVGSQI